jgi:hypothetical protein
MVAPEVVDAKLTTTALFCAFVVVIVGVAAVVTGEEVELPQALHPHNNALDKAIATSIDVLARIPHLRD